MMERRFSPRPRRPSSLAEEVVTRATAVPAVDDGDDGWWSDGGAIPVGEASDTDRKDGEASSDGDTPFRQSLLRVLDLADRAFVPCSDSDSDDGISSSTFCARCTELGLANIYPTIHEHLQSTNLIGLDDESINTIVQRLIFDREIPYHSSCAVCSAFTGHLPSTWHLQSTDDKRWEFSWSQADGYACYAHRTNAWGRILPGERFGPRAAARVISAGRRRVVDLQESVEGEVNYPALRQLLDLCEEEHVRCSSPPDSADFHDVLLIDVVERKLVPYPGAGCQYVALSYVWGGTAAIPFHRGELAPYTNQTIEDAIVAVEKLGLRYLWVDAICINQADERHLLSQLAIMGSIYACASATIIAFTAASAADGLSGVSAPRPSQPPPARVSFGTNELISSGPPFLHRKKSSPWLQRAWTFQEGLLSRRCLVWDEEEVYFICDEMQLRADRLHQQGQLLDRRETSEFTGWFIKQTAATELQPSSDGSHRQYEGLSDLVGQYFSRLLTKDSDRVRAFTGVLEEFRRSAFPGGFFFGLPKQDFQLALGWRIADGCPVKRNMSFPSWSWAGWQLSTRPSQASRGCCHWLTSNPALHPPLSIQTVSGELLCHESNTQHPSQPSRLEAFKQPIFNFVLHFNSHMSASPINDTLPTRTHTSESTLFLLGVIFPHQILNTPSWRPHTRRRGYPSGHLQISPDAYVHVLHGEEADEDHSSDCYLLHGFHAGGTPGRASLTLHMLQLRWEDGVAYRCGWILVEVPEGVLECIYEWEPRRGRFLLG